MKLTSSCLALLIHCFLGIAKSERGSGWKPLESPLELVDGDDEQQERQLRRRAPKTQKTGGVKKKKKKFGKNTKAPKLKDKKGKQCRVKCKTDVNGCVEFPAGSLVKLPCIKIDATGLKQGKCLYCVKL